MRWPLQPLQPLQQTQLQPPFGQSVDSLCHPWFTTTNVSYRFPILKLPPPPCAVLLVNYIHTFTVTYIHEHDMTVFPFLTWNVMKRLWSALHLWTVCGPLLPPHLWTWLRRGRVGPCNLVSDIFINKTIDVQTSGAYWVKRLRNLIPKLSRRLCAALCRRVPPESQLHGVDWRLSWVTEWKWLGLTSSFDPGTYSWSRHQSCSKRHATYEEI